jgi:hypothetical protein
MSSQSRLFPDRYGGLGRARRFGRLGPPGRGTMTHAWRGLPIEADRRYLRSHAAEL